MTERSKNRLAHWSRMAFAGVALALTAAASGASALAAPKPAPPRFAVSPSWPKVLPGNWLMGQVAGLSVDTSDHIWIFQRPSSLTDDEKAASFKPARAKCCVPAPSVIELDATGKVLRSWGKPEGGPWMGLEHGINVDSEGFVWLTGSNRGDGTLFKFTKDGKLVLKIGHDGPGATSSNDPSRLSGAAGVYVDVAAHEVYVADGYFNRRVIVFDSQTGAYKRHWGAYGKPPVDPPPAAAKPAAAPKPGEPEEAESDGVKAGSAPAQFNTVHCVVMSKAGLVYVCDRVNNRVQVFQKSGVFVKEFFLEPNTRLQGSAWGLAFWRRGGAEYLINADGANNEVRVLDPDTGRILSRLGRPGRMAGEFHWVHSLAVDSKGNLYTGEVQTGKRLQKFVPVTGK